MSVIYISTPSFLSALHHETVNESCHAPSPLSCDNSYQGCDSGEVPGHLAQHGAALQVPQLERLVLEHHHEVLPASNGHHSMIKI